MFKISLSLKYAKKYMLMLSSSITDFSLIRCVLAIYDVNLPFYGRIHPLGKKKNKQAPGKKQP